jgi:hypothetical protein
MPPPLPSQQEKQQQRNGCCPSYTPHNAADYCTCVAAAAAVAFDAAG